MSDTGGLFGGILAQGGARTAVGDRAWLQAMLDVEAALARAEARAGVITLDAAEAIGRACRADAFDADAIGEAATKGGNPVIPLVRALTEAIDGDARGDVHRGATSQDILDTAAMLIARRTLGVVLDDLTAASEAAAGLAREHRDTPIVARTLLQHALPTTFGLKAAVWMTGIDDAVARLNSVDRTRLAVEFGGGAGTLASLGDKGLAVLGYLAEELELNEPVLPWHTDRTRIADLAGALGGAAGAVGKPAADVILMAQTEVGEVREGVPGRGGSSTMPHKQNPIAAVAAVACAQRVPGLVSNLMSSLVHEHERAAGSWHAEWIPYSELFVAVGSGAAWLRDCLENIEVDTARMRANLDLTGGLLMAEQVSSALSSSLGRLAAHDLVERVTGKTAEGSSFAAALKDELEITEHVSAEEIDDLLDPTSYLGSAGGFVDRALRAHEARAGG